MCYCFSRLFGCLIPESTESTVVIRPTGKTFVTGMASQYDEEFDDERLSKYISQREYTLMMEDINDSVDGMFPCLFCWLIGYILCPFTFGLSLLLPAQCVNDAEDNMKYLCTRYNRRLLNEKNIKMVFTKTWCTSWIELRLLK